MTQPEQDPQPPKSHKIRRNQVYIGLAIAAGIAFVITQCGDDNSPDAPIEIVFYQTVAQCEADINRQQAEYQTLLQQYQAGQLDEPPNPLPMQAKDCTAQMKAAQEEHKKTAPVYNSIADCQAEGVQCEATPAGETIAGYRPVYGGSYIDPYDAAGSTYVYYGSTQYRVYSAYPVYRSINAGSIVTPYGREISQVTTGRVSAPRHTTFTAPARPTGTAASGTIRGRSTQGFGSSFKSTGSRGK
jgi:uncharacterized protein YgiB involved in biofilm formation